MTKPRVAINGFGRIGRMVFRSGFSDLDIVAVNDPGGIDSAMHLLKYDSTHGIFPKEIKKDGNDLLVGDKKIKFCASRKIQDLPWKDLNVDIVMECTGVFKTKEEAEQHIQQGAKRVIVSAPAKGVDLTMVYGINHEAYKPEKDFIISNASCTTNCLAPVAKVLNDHFEIENGMMTTIHAYTSDQRILDASHKDLRRARSAALSMIPTTTGAAIAVTKVLPELKGKLDGMAIRVPTPNVSVVDFSFQTKKSVTKEAINNTLKEASQSYLKGVLKYEEEPLVSVDFNGDTHSSIIDAPSTMTMGSNFAKVLSWYDNEVGFSCRMVDFANYMYKAGL